MSHPVEVVFNRSHSRYGPGERAGFSPEYAHELLSKGIARKAPDREPEEVRVAKAQEQDKPQRVDVVFLRKHRMYQPGEVAGFSAANAEILVESQIAAYRERAETSAVDEDNGGQSQEGSPPPWGDTKPSKGDFVAHYKTSMTKEEILHRANEDMGLGLDEQLTKAQLLSEVYDHAFGDSNGAASAE